MKEFSILIKVLLIMAIVLVSGWLTVWFLGVERSNDVEEIIVEEEEIINPTPIIDRQSITDINNWSPANLPQLGSPSDKIISSVPSVNYSAPEVEVEKNDLLTDEEKEINEDVKPEVSLVFTYLNQKRQARGLFSLSLNDNLNFVATRRVQAIIEGKPLLFNENQIKEAINLTGYDYAGLAEQIAITDPVSSAFLAELLDKAARSHSGAGSGYKEAGIAISPYGDKYIVIIIYGIKKRDCPAPDHSILTILDDHKSILNDLSNQIEESKNKQDFDQTRELIDLYENRFRAAAATVASYNQTLNRYNACAAGRL
ncbi:MAG: hypothetical protein ACOCU8_00605 [Patescibacteria group bacterium]